MTKETILNYLTTHKKEFQKKYNISRITLFGSYARGENRKNSDVDILYSLKEGAKFSYDKYIEFEDELKKAFDTRVDLVNEKNLNPLIKIEALKDFIYV